VLPRNMKNGRLIRCRPRSPGTKLRLSGAGNKPSGMGENEPQDYMLCGGRFLSHHIGAEVYYDSRRRVVKTLFTGGGHGELIRERQPDWSYRNQILLIVSPDGKRSTIEYTL
jgi:hypothetical protein